MVRDAPEGGLLAVGGDAARRAGDLMSARLVGIVDTVGHRRRLVAVVQVRRGAVLAAGGGVDVVL